MCHQELKKCSVDPSSLQPLLNVLWFFPAPSSTIEMPGQMNGSAEMESQLSEELQNAQILEDKPEVTTESQQSELSGRTDGKMHHNFRLVYYIHLLLLSD